MPTSAAAILSSPSANLRDGRGRKDRNEFRPHYMTFQNSLRHTEVNGAGGESWGRTRSAENTLGEMVEVVSPVCRVVRMAVDVPDMRDVPLLEVSVHALADP